MDWLIKYENPTELYTNAERRWPTHGKKLNAYRDYVRLFMITAVSSLKSGVF